MTTSNADQDSNASDESKDANNNDNVFSKNELELINERRNFYKQIALLYVVAAVLVAPVVLVYLENRRIFKISEENLFFINEGFNAMLWLTTPFSAGAMGAGARLLLSGVQPVRELPLIFGSGLMAAFSWVGVKSGILISIVAPHISTYAIENKDVISSSKEFYTMFLLAIFVGMFSSNLYLFINQRVESILSKKQESQDKQ